MYKKIMYKKWTYKKWNYKKCTYKKRTYEKRTYKKKTDPFHPTGYKKGLIYTKDCDILLVICLVSPSTLQDTRKG